MSEYTFGDMSYSGGQPGDGQDSGLGQGQGGPQDQGPKWFRDYMAQSAQQIKQLSGQLEAMTAEKRQSEIVAAFEAKGYAPGAAALYQGEPDKVDEWLGTHGGALARADQQQQQGSRPPGEMPPPQQQNQAPAVPPSVQADLQKMQQMGQTGALGSSGNSDDDLAAALRATTNPTEFLQVAQAHGWQYNADNMGFM